MRRCSSRRLGAAAPDAANPPFFALKLDAGDADAGSEEEEAEEASATAEEEEEDSTAAAVASIAEGVARHEEDIKDIYSVSNDSFAVSILFWEILDTPYSFAFSTFVSISFSHCVSVSYLSIFHRIAL